MRRRSPSGTEGAAVHCTLNLRAVLHDVIRLIGTAKGGPMQRIVALAVVTAFCFGLVGARAFSQVSD